MNSWKNFTNGQRFNYVTRVNAEQLYTLTSLVYTNSCSMIKSFDRWIFGDFLCKMYNFVHYLSYTASVMILVVNCVERYVAIMRPFRAKTILSHRNLVVSMWPQLYRTFETTGI